ncbi:hypothetical protein, partial [Priestia filamentosa]|uniref:hypothetical protein n=1 Tax=Priestia filamentosa TaxID=1402861 RepID=UPI00397B663B
KMVKAYRGIVEVNKDKNPLLLLDSPPLYGTFKKGHEVINNNPIPGSYEKWLCIEGGSPGLWKGVSPIESFRSGIETFNGDGSTIKQIPHNLNKLPKTWYVQAASKDAGESEIKYIYCDNTNLNVVFKNPTKNGVNNIVLNWRADLL